MRVKCCVTNCKNLFPNSNVSFFSISENRTEWLLKIRRPDLLSRKNARICSAHFEDRYFKNRSLNRLLSDAILRLFLNDIPLCVATGIEESVDDPVHNRQIDTLITDVAFCVETGIEESVDDTPSLPST